MVNKIKNLLKNKAVLFTLLSAISSGINFLSLLVFGRVFEVEGFAVVTTFQAFVANVAVFMTPLQIMICKNISEKDEHNSDTHGYINMALFICLLECAILTIGTTVFIRYLHFVSLIEYILFVVLVLANNIYTVVIGMAQGKQRFTLLGISGILLYSIKMIIGVLLGLLGIGPLAVIIGFALADIICIACIVCRIRDAVGQKEKVRLGKDKLINYFWLLCLYTIVSMYLNSGDLLLANLYCSQREIGLYSVAINLSKISVYLIATPVATVLLPKVVVCKGDIERQRKTLLLAEGVTLGVSIVYGIAYFALCKWLIPFLYGSNYKNAAYYVLPCIVFSIVLGMFWVFYQYAVATDIMKPFTVVTAGFGIILIITSLVFRLSLSILPIAMAAAMAISVLAVLLYVRYSRGVADAV